MTPVRAASISAAAVAAVVMVAVPAAAQAAPGLSTDGVHWSHSLALPLFDPGVRWVPGDSRSASFYVRNDATDPAVLVVAAHTSDPDGVLAAGDVTVSARVGDHPWQALPRSGRTHTLAPLQLPEAGVRRVELRAGLADAAPNTSQYSTVSLTLGVTLSQQTASAAGNDLGATGLDVRLLISTAAVLMGCGIALARAGSGNSRGREHG